MIIIAFIYKTFTDYLQESRSIISKKATVYVINFWKSKTDFQSHKTPKFVVAIGSSIIEVTEPLIWDKRPP